MISKPTPRPRTRKPLASRPKGVNRDLRERVFIRDNYLCQWCLVAGGALDPHHILPRGRGGKDTLDGLISVHRACHRYIHTHPLEAYERGFLLRSEADL